MKLTHPLYIFDLDGTLANHQHRVHMLDDTCDRDRWRRFYALCGGDSPIRPVISTMHKLRFLADVWIFTGRSEEVRDETVAWLTKHTTFTKHELDTALVMRQIGDTRADDVVKRSWLDGMLIDDRKRLVAVFEDRDRVVAMWRAAGVPCFQVAAGAF